MKGDCSDMMIRSQKLGLLYQNLPLTLLATILNGGILAFLLSDVIAVEVAAGWFAVNLAVSLLRYISYYFYKVRKTGQDERWYRIFVAGVVATALVWAATSVLFFTHDSVVHQVFLAFVIAGMVAGAVSSLSQIFFVYAIYNLAVLLPLIYQFLSGSHEIHPYMSAMIVLFMLITLVSARRMSRTIEESFRLRCANEELIEALSSEKEKVLEALQEAKLASRSKDTFLANMSHEIRTPLNGVIGFAQLLAKSSLNERQEQYVTTIEQSSKTLLGILNDILDFSKIETGNIVLEKTAFSLPEELEPTLHLFDTLAEEKSIDYRIELPETRSQCLIGDPLRIKQILSNLVSNAIKFTPQNGVVEVTIGMNEADEEKVNVSFSVKDSGEGIQAENLSKIFEAFSQEDTSISRRFGGTGLGLAICRNFVQMMGSQLHVESTPSKGSTFTFELELPRCREEASVAHAVLSSEAAAEENEGVILVVEDNPTNQMVVEIMLEEELGYRCEMANNGREAIEKFEAGSEYRLVLMDINMPEMDGVEATRRIRRYEQEHTKSRTPIIALSANVFKQDQQRYIDAGMDDVMGKPIILETLKEKVKQHMG